MNLKPDLVEPAPAESFAASILVVDDERHNRQLLEVILAPEGFRVLTAASGEEALAIVAQQPPDLILLDVMMPGMDGYQVAAKIKGNPATNSIPVIMVTALDTRDAKMRALRAGAEEFLTKPVDRVELCARVRNLARLKAHGDDKQSQIIEGEVGSRTAELVTRTKSLERQAAGLTEQAALLDLAQDAIVVRDMHGRISFWSRGAEAMYGWPGNEALGRGAHELLRAEFAEPIEDIENALLHDGQWEGEAVHYKRDGTRVMVASRWALQRDAEGAPVRVLTLNNDITARKQTDAELLVLTERLSLATAVAKVGVWELDLASNMLAWDATMFDIYGRTPVVPMPYDQWSAAVSPEDLPAVEETLQRTIADKGHGAAEYRIILSDGSTRNIAAVERVVLDERGNVSRVIGVNMDVTERKVAEGALEQSRRDQLRFKDEFLSHVSHELRSPLTAIKQFTTILLGGIAGELNTEQREYQYIVLKNIQQLQAMIDDLLEVTRLETGKLTVEPERVHLSGAVTDALDTFQISARMKEIALSADLSPGLPTANADPTRLHQILIILLDNAIKFTPAGGAVHIHAQLSQEDLRFLLVEVSDTGCGISAEMIGKTFERLYQVSPTQVSRKGLGLGLYICKELVTRQGGRIWAKGELTKGSTFAFTLPVFSLANVLAPFLKNDGWPAESLALIMVFSPGPWRSKASQDEWSQQARSLVQRCLMPDLDVLLPRMRFGTEGERLFVAAFADARGASALTNRIREQCDRHLEHAGRAMTITYGMLRPVSSQGSASTEGTVSNMAAHLEKAIASRISSEGCLS